MGILHSHLVKKLSDKNKLKIHKMNNEFDVQKELDLMEELVWKENPYGMDIDTYNKVNKEYKQKKIDKMKSKCKNITTPKELYDTMIENDMGYYMRCSMYGQFHESRFYYIAFFFHLNNSISHCALDYAIRRKYINPYLMQFITTKTNENGKPINMSEMSDNSCLYGLLFDIYEKEDIDIINYDHLNNIFKCDSSHTITNNFAMVMTYKSTVKPKILIKIINLMITNRWNPYTIININFNVQRMEGDYGYEDSERISVIDYIRRTDEKVADMIKEQYDNYLNAHSN